MIIEWLTFIAFGIVEWIAENLLTWEGEQPEDFWGDVSGLVGQFASIGVWLNWGAVLSAVGLAITVWLACLTIKAVRALIAHIPQFGGAG